MRTAVLVLFIMLGWSLGSDVTAQMSVVIDDFEQYEANSLPNSWKMPDIGSRTMRPLTSDDFQLTGFMNVVVDNGNKVLRAFTEAEAVKIALPRGLGLRWDIDSFPRLRWRWRADQLPEGAREDSRKLNDTGAALYVAFQCNDWIGRPCTIKYTYSSTLPKETQVHYGKLHVFVVSTALDPEAGWTEIERNVVEDYMLLFGKPPKGDPLYIILWNDTDTTGGTADVYFDDIVVMTEE